jgi:rare lipoprotein A (peptidoglycan hydrolase)
VKVTNVANGRSVVVTVNNRMASSNSVVNRRHLAAAEELAFVFGRSRRMVGREP